MHLSEIVPKPWYHVNPKPKPNLTYLPLSHRQGASPHTPSISTLLQNDKSFRGSSYTRRIVSISLYLYTSHSITLTHICQATSIAHNKITPNTGYSCRHRNVLEHFKWKVPLHVADSWAKQQDDCQKSL